MKFASKASATIVNFTIAKLYNVPSKRDLGYFIQLEVIYLSVAFF